MKIEFSVDFMSQLDSQCRFIARDKPAAAQRFKKEILRSILELKKSPYACRKSIYFKVDHIRDFVFKGYKIPYHIDKSRDVILILGLVNMQQGSAEE
jgi:plasmid stabilization system protein ParE